MYKDPKEEKTIDPASLFAILVIVVIGGLILSIIYSHTSSKTYSERYEEYEQARSEYVSKMKPIVKKNYEILITRGTKISCGPNTECYETPFCEIRKSGTQSVVYDIVSKEKLATFSEDFYPYSKSETEIAKFCMGDNNEW